ncbi:glycoside hydrolase family 43 protein [Paracidovorax avenae]|uniref:glycoside hydrolase family 43 protein n=1 Tax=Paracidovorax avenae TaxID=80867 RepID=UPI000D21249A|nr:glycoside hydrolase family 43 protein [Paracidovorax avenae]AVS96341.1 1,4-beta-xylanase [Paracidovorax avenae]AVT10123.1 1,4-beta-xylanase [Paracidovorax avenae]
MRKTQKSLRALFVAATLAVSFGSAQAQSGGYLLVHFTGESASGEQTYMAVSSDGMHWTDLNNSQPVLMSTVGEKGVRDHSIVRSPDGSKYWILATDLRIANGKGWDTAMHRGSTKLVIWESSDLVHWSAPRLADVAGAIPSAGCAWAPEAIWDPASNAYIVYWTTISPLNGVDKPRIYYAKTTDFVTFTAPRLYIDRPGDQPIIDTQIIEVAGSVGGYQYVRASGDGQITLEGSQSVLGAWTTIGDLSQVGLTGQMVEGPILFKFNGETKWGLWVDQYASGKGYLPLTSVNMGSAQNWQIASEGSYHLGASHKRHGGILSLNDAELSRLQAQWGGTTPIHRLQSSNFPDRYVRHANFTSVRIDANVSPEDDSKFRIVKGLADNAGYVSFASVNQPGYYLRQKNFAFELAPYDGSPQFAADATFAEVLGLADTTGSSFQSYSQPNYYMRHYAYQLRLDTIGDDATSRSDATFRITD